jgi:hypothetical protein
MSNNQVASIISGLGNNLAKRVGGSGNKGGTNRFDRDIAEINNQGLLRAQVIAHITGQDAAEREHERSNAAARLDHEHTTLQATQKHQQEMEKLNWVANNSVHGGNVRFRTAAGDSMEFKAHRPDPAPSKSSSSKSKLATRVMADGSHLPTRHRQAYVNGTRAEKQALNKKHFYNK